MNAPILMLGPGGDYTTAWNARDNGRLVPSSGSHTASEGDGHQSGYQTPNRRRQTLAPKPALRSRPHDTFEPSGQAAPAYTLNDSFEEVTLLAAASAWLTEQMNRLAVASASLHRFRNLLTWDADNPHHRQRNLLPNTEPHHEPHAQTTPHPQPNPRPSLGARLLANDAGTRRRAGRQQSHRLRTRRSPHQEGSLAAAAQQGALFGVNG